MKCYEVLLEQSLKKGMTSSDLAKKVGINYELVRRSLNGTRKIGADEFVVWCDVLGLKLKDFAS